MTNGRTFVGMPVHGGGNGLMANRGTRDGEAGCCFEFVVGVGGSEARYGRRDGRLGRSAETHQTRSVLESRGSRNSSKLDRRDTGRKWLPVRPRDPAATRFS